MKPLVLVSGIPATGKSTYGAWLERYHGFRHFDIEHDDFGGNRELKEAWNVITRLPPPPVAPFVHALKKLDRPVVLEWGYPPPWLPLVKALHGAGVATWWFDGDRDAARQAFVDRRTVRIDDFNAQMRSIETHRPVISAFYQGRVIYTVRPDGTFPDWNTVFSAMFRAYQ